MLKVVMEHPAAVVARLGITQVGFLTNLGRVMLVGLV
tara:strand:+ start:253 stop:363 length:111 start_codon:yes stop_codon:yes gene_type:complete